MSNELEGLDKYLKAEIDGLELSPSGNHWSSVEQKLDRSASLRKENTIRKLRLSLSIVIPAFCLFVAYHYYNKAHTRQAENKTKPLVASNNSAAVKSAELSAATHTEVAEVNTAKNSLDKPFEKTSEKPGVQTDVNNKSNPEEAPVLLSRPVTSLNEKAPKSAVPDKITVLKYVLPAETREGPKISGQDEATDDQRDEQALQATEENSQKAFFIPNAFTPNGDGLNDLFIPKASEEPKEYKLSIYDRNGILVFFTDNFKTGWDGKVNRSGAETIKQDIYMWRIEMKNANGEKEHLMGSVSLLK